MTRRFMGRIMKLRSSALSSRNADITSSFFLWFSKKSAGHWTPWYPSLQPGRNQKQRCLLLGLIFDNYMQSLYFPDFPCRKRRCQPASYCLHHRSYVVGTSPASPTDIDLLHKGMGCSDESIDIVIMMTQVRERSVCHDVTK